MRGCNAHGRSRGGCHNCGGQGHHSNVCPSPPRQSNNRAHHADNSEDTNNFGIAFVANSTITYTEEPEVAGDEIPDLTYDSDSDEENSFPIVSPIISNISDIPDDFENTTTGEQNICQNYFETALMVTLFHLFPYKPHLLHSAIHLQHFMTVLLTLGVQDTWYLNLCNLQKKEATMAL